MTRKIASKRKDILRFFYDVVLPYKGDDCLFWPFARSGAGYGQIRMDQKLRYVHRLACAHKHGPSPEGKSLALHICGSGHLGCCNPNHMRWGTQTENMKDRMDHGYCSKGENHPNSKLSETDVLEIMALKGQMSQRAIAARFNIVHATVGLIHAGKRWPHITQQ